MEERKRIIPEIVLRHKGPDARIDIFERYFERHRKSIFMAFAWWFALSAFGAHRIYLGQYKAAAIIFGISFAVMLTNAAIVAAGGYGEIILGVLILIFIVEGVWLLRNIDVANEKLRQTLGDDIRSVRYISLSQPAARRVGGTVDGTK